MLDEPVALVGLLPGSVDVVRKLVPVVLQKLFELVALEGSSISLRNDLVLDGVGGNLSIGPGIVDAVVCGVEVLLHGAEEVVSLGLDRGPDVSLLLEPVADGVVIP